jgi:hypothetical protein
MLATALVDLAHLDLADGNHLSARTRAEEAHDIAVVIGFSREKERARALLRSRELSGDTPPSPPSLRAAALNIVNSTSRRRSLRPISLIDSSMAALAKGDIRSARRFASLTLSAINRDAQLSGKLGSTVRADCHLLLSDCRRASGQLFLALQHSTLALAEYKKAGWLGEFKSGTRQSTIIHNLVETNEALGDHAEALVWAQAGVDYCPPHPPRAMAQALLDLANTSATADHDHAKTVADNALQLAETSGDQDIVIESLGVLARLETNEHSRIAYAARAVSLVEHNDDPTLRLGLPLLQLQLAIYLCVAGQNSEAAAVVATMNKERAEALNRLGFTLLRLELALTRADIADATAAADTLIHILSTKADEAVRHGSKSGFWSSFDEMIERLVAIALTLNAASPGGQVAPKIGLTAIEASRRSGLVATVRRGRLQLPEAARALVDRIIELEAAQSTRWQSLMTDPGGDTPPPTQLEQGWAAALDDARSALSTQFQTIFATGYAPSSMVTQETIDGLAGRHGLTYHVSQYVPGSALTGAVCHINDIGAVTFEPIQLSGHPLTLLEHLAHNTGPGKFSDAIWKSLADCLLPTSLTDAINRASRAEPITLVVAPCDPLLTSVPWAGLPTTNGPLIERTILATTPTLSLLRGEPTSHRAADAPPLLYFGEYDGRFGLAQLDLRREQGAWKARPGAAAVTAHDPADLRRALDGRSIWSLAYIAGHGGGQGLDQYFIHPDGTHLSASEALTLHWPEVVIITCCYAGGVSVVAGHDPFGLPVSCLLRGARTVIGCNRTVNDDAAGSIGASIAYYLSAGHAPFDAVRRAELDWLDHATWKSERNPATWGAFVVTTLD